ncbi:MAG: type II toxin-antitoxin system VapC family toxin [Gammaproteobacteria bacterium]|nr:type II toxin-antitoxin system VapC family toxin [Gammaproteobacteria bacterium]
MNVVDSSAWLEFFAGGRNAGRFATPIAATASLLVPTLSIYEVFKRILQQRGDDDALQAVAIMEQGRVVDLDRSIALAAARISIDHALPLADSVMLATARSFHATFWTQDANFKGIDDVKYFPRQG